VVVDAPEHVEKLALLLELRARHHRRAHIGAEPNAVTSLELVGAEEAVARSVTGDARFRGVELEIGAFAAARRLDRPAVQLYELPAPVLDTRIVHDLLQSVCRCEIAGDALTVLIEMEQHVFADLEPLRAAALAERDPRARA